MGSTHGRVSALHQFPSLSCYLAATLLLCLLTVHQALVWRPVSELSKVEIFCATALFMRRCVVLYGVFFVSEYTKVLIDFATFLAVSILRKVAIKPSQLS